ncbi:MAG: tetratricopeptide repeat protein [Ignavibacteriaceae bacterium]
MTSIKKIIAGYNFLSIYLLIIFLINLILQFIPLTNVFGYEFSVVNSILLSFLSGIYFISVYKKLETTGQRKHLISNLKIAFLSFILLPLVISIFHSFFTISCSLYDGFLFYIVITFPSIIIGASLGIISISIFKRFSNSIFIVLFLSILLIPLFEFYFNPQIYFYNPIFAYFPGTIYDEGLSVGFRLIIYRLLNLIFFGIILLLLLRDGILKTKIKRILFLALSLIIALAFIFLSSQLGFSTNFSKLNHVLENKVETEHFVIHFPAQVDSQLLKAVCLTHEFYYSELSKFFGYEMPKKIDSYIFLNNDQKKELIGSANADIAKPWLDCSFISLNDYEETLKHEIAHCFTSKFGTGIFKIASGLNPALIEGAAVAAVPFFDEHSIDFMAALAYKNGYKINLSKLYGGFSFYTQASSLSYVYAGSFSKYIISNFGINRFEKFYSSNNFKKVYGTDINKIVKRYYKYLDGMTFDFNPNEANYYFGIKSIFYKVCPRYVSDRLTKAWQYFNVKDYSSAEKIFSEIQTLTDNYSGLMGLAECLVKENKIFKAAGLLKKKVESFKNTSYYFGIELKLADVDFLSGDILEADSLYKNLIKQNPNKKYYYLTNLRLDLMKNEDLLKTYLTGNDYDRFILLKDQNKNEYDYNSIPVLIDLAKYFNINYGIVKEIFSKPFSVTDFASSYALYKISDFMFEHLDFENAAKTAAIAFDYNADADYNIFLKENINKINWCNSHASYIFTHSKFYR